jgi:hypothetical protein
MLSLNESHRDRWTKSIRKMSVPAHVRWGEPVQGIGAYGGSRAFLQPLKPDVFSIIYGPT